MSWCRHPKARAIPAPMVLFGCCPGPIGWMEGALPATPCQSIAQRKAPPFTGWRAICLPPCPPPPLCPTSAGGIHETGHALYMQGLNPDYWGLPVGNSAGMGFHESQSLTWERMVALSRPFSDYLLPLLKERFPDQVRP